LNFEHFVAVENVQSTLSDKRFSIEASF